MSGADDVVKLALKLIAGGSDDAAKRIASIRRSEPFPADYIEPGSVRYRYEHPDTSSFMEIITRPKGARSASVIGLEVPEEYRGTGIGKALQERVLQDYPSLMGQVSSKAAAVNAYKAGRRPLANPDATLEDVFKMIDEDSSVNLATEKNIGGSIREGYQTKGRVVGDIVDQALKLVMGEGDDAAKAGIRAYHGSPHDFDRFDMSKIGTGEGAQAYGHGLYFAEAEDVARGYRDALSRDVSYDGQPVAKAHPMDDPMAGAIHAVASRVREGADPREAIAEQAAMWQDYADKMVGFSKGKPELEALIPQRTKGFLDIVGSINKLDPDKFRKNPGRMYEVEINADPDAFLDWDKPLSEQPEKVRKGLEAAGFSPPPGGELMTGAQVYSRAMQNDPGAWGSTKEYVRAAMNELGGIPGIKYLDAGSRGAGDGTRNYVVFDDKLISIIRKYGIAGASAMLGYNLMEHLDPVQARAASIADRDYQASRPQRSMGGNNSISGAMNVARGLYGDR